VFNCHATAVMAPHTVAGLRCRRRVFRTASDTARPQQRDHRGNRLSAPTARSAGASRPDSSCSTG